MREFLIYWCLLSCFVSFDGGLVCEAQSHQKIKDFYLQFSRGNQGMTEQEVRSQLGVPSAILKREESKEFEFYANVSHVWLFGSDNKNRFPTLGTVEIGLDGLVENSPSSLPGPRLELFDVFADADTIQYHLCQLARIESTVNARSFDPAVLITATNSLLDIVFLDNSNA